MLGLILAETEGLTLELGLTEGLTLDDGDME